MAGPNLIITLLALSVGLSKEIQYKDIPLSGLITNPKQEISGLDWYGNDLVLLPENLEGFLYMISRPDIYASINSDSPSSIKPKKTPFITPDYSKSIPGFEGLEAIAFYGDNVYITLEVEDEKTMRGYLAWGTIDPISLKVTIPEENLMELETPIQIKNMTYESLLIHNGELILFYEAQGRNLQKSVWQFQVSLTDFSVSKIDFPHVEYRITDVSRLDDQDKFWAINYLWPGDTKRLNPAPDSIAIKFGEGESHQQLDAVERLIEFEIQENKIQFSGREPIQIQLDADGSRNWEGIVRLDELGFLIATDKYPGMILGFIPFK